MKISQRLGIAAGCAVLVGLMTAAGSWLGGSSAPENAGVPDSVSVAVQGTIPFKTNDHGLTYGSELDAATPADAPDLILAIATNGKEGYVRRDDLYPQLPTSPAEAIAWQKDRTESVTRIPVYTLDGITAIGDFEISPPVVGSDSIPD